MKTARWIVRILSLLLYAFLGCYVWINGLDMKLASCLATALIPAADCVFLYAYLVVPVLSGIAGAIINRRGGRVWAGAGLGLAAYCVLSGFADKIMLGDRLPFGYALSFVFCVIISLALVGPKREKSDGWSYGGYGDSRDPVDDMTGDEHFIDPDGGDIDVSDM